MNTGETRYGALWRTHHSEHRVRNSRDPVLLARVKRATWGQLVDGQAAHPGSHQVLPKIGLGGHIGFDGEVQLYHQRNERCGQIFFNVMVRGWAGRCIRHVPSKGYKLTAARKTRAADVRYKSFSPNVT